MAKPKILWFGDILSNTGFARVTQSILTHLAPHYEIVCLGINYYGDPYDLPYRIYPATATNPQDRFGIGRLPQIVEQEKPDFIIALNDIWIVNQVWERIHLLKPQLKFKFLAYFPIDAEYYTPQHLRYIKDWDFPVTFSIPQAQRLIKQGVETKKLGVIPHGIDVTKFFPIDRKEAREKLKLPQDKFMVLNANRNQPRKCIDLTIKAFAEFAEGKDDTMLYLHMGEKDLGWDVRALFDTEMRRRNLEPEKRLIMTSNNINYLHAPPDEILNLIYNSTDVGVNTANGEGWGLVPFEHAACKKPQIVPNHTACSDVWAEKGLLADVACWIWDKDLLVERGLVDVHDMAQKLTALYEDPDYATQVGNDCYEVTQNPSYRWDKVAEGFHKAIEEVLK